MIESILIANRGEIACRIIRTCRHLGIRAVAVYSEADAQSLHVELADEAIYLGPAPASESYLSIEKLIEAARRSEVDAIHPGFGFLAENSDFAQACADASLIFIGPTPAAISAMGNKRAARALVSAKVPVVPGYDGDDQTDEALSRATERIGWPLIVKAAAGGGGKGMRLVHEPSSLAEALSSARREARQAFGSDDLLLERAIARPRHIEFQVFGDQHGQIIHLGERECSIQRRHQKVIEEAPSLALSAELRSTMGSAAVEAARTVGYVGAGTVEFLLDQTGNFYFLEMNTRLQVEHPVTEYVTGLDLVEWQIRIAEGAPLPLRQDEVHQQGYAIEARLYAEDPANEFLPVTGRIALWQAPAAEGVRVESGIRSGDEVSIYYDPMLAKIIAHAPTREGARRRLLRALETTVLLGLTCNLSYLHAILAQPAYATGDLSTNFLSEHLADWRAPATDVQLALCAATLAQWTQHSQIPTNAGFWRNNLYQPSRYLYALDDHEQPAEVTLMPLRLANHYTLLLNLPSQPPLSVPVELNAWDTHTLTLTRAGLRQRVTLANTDTNWWVQSRSGTTHLRSLPLLPQPVAAPDAGGSLRAPMPGSVLQVLVTVGQQVAKGDPLLKLEAMKMEHTIRTAAPGIVEEIFYSPGDTVAADTLLVKMRELPAQPGM